MSAGDAVKSWNERLVSDGGQRVHNTLDTTSVTQLVKIHQRLRRLLLALLTDCRVDPMSLILTINSSVLSFIDWNLNTKTPTDNTNCSRA